MLDPAAAELWFAGQPLAPGAPLSARLGRNDKTRVVLRLQHCGQGAPIREPVRHVPWAGAGPRVVSAGADSIRAWCCACSAAGRARPRASRCATSLGQV